LRAEFDRIPHGYKIKTNKKQVFDKKTNTARGAINAVRDRSPTGVSKPGQAILMN